MSRRLTLLPVLMLVLALAFFTGCSDDNSSAPTQADEDLVNTEPTQDDYDLIAEDLSYSLTDSETGMAALWAPPVDDGGEPPVPDDGMALRDFSELHDTTIVHDHMTITHDFTFYDAEDNASEEYDEETTVRMTRATTMDGSIDDEFRTMQMTMEGFFDLAGIGQNDEIRTVNDTGMRSEVGEMTGRFEDHLRTIDATHEWDAVDVQHHIDHETYPYPLSGSITRHTDLYKTMETPRGTRTFEMDITSTITFDGTEWATVVMDDGSEYQINLDHGRCHRGPRRP